MRTSSPPSSRRTATDLSTTEHDRSRGQALVEFSLLLPVFLALALLAVDFGRLFFDYVSVSNAAREGAFYAAVHAGDNDYDQSSFETAVIQAALNEVSVQAQGGTGTPVVSAPTCFDPASGTAVGCDAASNFKRGIGNQVSVSVARDFTFLTPVIGEILGGGVTLSVEATAPVMNPASVSISPASTAAPTATPTPTASPTPAPTASSSPTPAPTASSSPTPAPSPTATPVPDCEVPNFKNGYWNNTGGVPALTVWHDQAGFTGTLTNDAGEDKINWQTIKKGNIVPCSSDMVVFD